MAFNPFVTRAARVTVTVTREDSSSDTGVSTSQYVFQEHRMIIRVSLGGGRFGNAKVSIHGVPLANMNNISRLWLVPLQIQAQDTIAIDVWDGSTYVPFFNGVISWAGTDGSALPDVTLNIEANAAFGLSQTTPAPYSASGTQTLENVLTGILQNTGFTLDLAPSVPPLTVTNPRYSGSAQDQLDACLRAFPNIAFNVTLQRVRVYPTTQPFGTDPILVSPTTGAVGAPNYSSSAVTWKTLFNPQLVPGQAILLDSEFVLSGGANWVCRVLNHTLEPNKPKGAWHTDFAAVGIPNADGTGTPS